MPIALLGDILRNAQSGNYGVPYCESWNLESAQAVVDAAEKLNSPAIVGFNGGFLQHPSRQRPEKLAWYAGVRLALESASVPVSLLLNESTSLDQIEQAIRLGFNAVMPENEGVSLDGLPPVGEERSRTLRIRRASGWKRRLAPCPRAMRPTAPMAR